MPKGLSEGVDIRRATVGEGTEESLWMSKIKQLKNLIEMENKFWLKEYYLLNFYLK
jgi:hypothetical protein